MMAENKLTCRFALDTNSYDTDIIATAKELLHQQNEEDKSEDKLEENSRKSPSPEERYA